MYAYVDWSNQSRRDANHNNIVETAETFPIVEFMPVSIEDHLDHNDLHDSYKSAYRRGHSTETDLLKVHIDIKSFDISYYQIRNIGLIGT